MPPTAGTLVLDLRARLKMNPDEEIAIRRELWYAALHTEKGRGLLERNKKFGAFFNQNIEKLIEIMPTKNEHGLLLKAELFRQSGKFKEAIIVKNTSAAHFAPSGR
jgi:hypothetical protein